MKKYALLLLACCLFSFFSRAQSDEDEVKNVIDIFFDGFHKRDTAVMNSVVHGKVMMHSVSVSDKEEVKLSSEDFGKFLKSIAGIPETTRFEEKLHAYFIVIDGAMANVRTPYTFYLNGSLSHCGMNNFQLARISGNWKIIYLVDTRTKDNCL